MNFTKEPEQSDGVIFFSNLLCTLVVTASNSSLSLSMTFEDWDMGVTDSLTIYDGPTSSYNNLGSWWSSSSQVNSTGRSLTLVFTSDSFGSLRGFKAKFTDTTRGTPSCSPGSTVVMASTTTQSISSSGYPMAYSNGVNEYWLIEKPSESNNLVLNIIDMDVEEAANCVYDSITLYDGACTTDPALAVVCGSSAVTFEDASGLYVLVHFHTDSSVTRKGFTMEYYIGSFADEDEDSVELADWVIPTIVLSVIILIIIVGSVVFCINRQRAGRQVNAHRFDSDPRDARPKLVRKLTTHQLLAQFKTQCKQKHQLSKPGLSQAPGHIPPNPPGPNTVILNRGQMTPHPPPSGDPVYPPNIMDTGGTAMPKPLAPALPPGSTFSPSAPVLLPIDATPGTIPPAFRYISPAEARAAAEAEAQARAQSTAWQ